MAISNRRLKKIKKLISNTPFNRNYIADTVLKNRIKEAVPYIKGVLLDVGCGEKPYETFFEKKIKKYIGIDIPNSFPLGGSEHADIFGNGCQLPFKSNTFDSLICTQMLEHIEQPQKIFKEFSRVLKKSGILVLTASKTWEKRIGSTVPDYFRYNDEILIKLAENQQLDVVSIRECGGFFAMIGQLLARFLNKEIIYHKTTKSGIEKQPNIVAAILVLPLIAIIQIIFILLDKIYYSKIDTLFYIIIAKKN